MQIRRLECNVIGKSRSSDSLRTNIYLLRKAVDAEGEAPLIQTHPGFGWACAPSDEPKA